MGAMLMLLLAVLQCTLIFGFNVDDKNIKIFSSGEATRGKSYFGYSTALYSRGNDSVLLVGAPRANSSFFLGAFEPGAVYRCSITRNLCNEWFVDFSTNTSIPALSRFYEEQDKDRSWLGATMELHLGDLKDGAKVAICAPRWKKVSTQFKRRSYMNGMCLTKRVDESTPENSRRYFPLSREHSQTVVIDGKNYYHRGMAEAGFSLHWPASSRWQFTLGAPGCAVSKGSSLLINERYEKWANMDNFNAVVPNVIDDSRFEAYDYFGYSITSGQFHKPGELEYAAGAPRSSRTRGKVFIYQFASSINGQRFSANNMFLQVRDILEGEQYGEYFGYALAACDVNSDGRDDLIIGSPFWSKLSDEGRVYAYVSSNSEAGLQGSERSFEVQRITGDPEIPGARFGSTISCLGDLDHDGYADVAIAAPYEDERGAVYIFQGRVNGLSQRHSQKIRASELGPNLRGFGQTISSNLEANLLAVGAYLSGHAVVLSIRPVLVMGLQLRILDDNFSLWTNQTLIPLEFCSNYDGMDSRAPSSILVTFNLQVDKFHHRSIIYDKAAYGDTYKFDSTLIKGRERCTSVKIYIKKNLQNVIDPLQIKAEVNLTDTTCPKCPVFHPELSKTVAELKLAFLLDCGQDAVCHSNLQVLNISTGLPFDSNGDRRFVIGSKSNVDLILQIGNSGEPAYRAQVHIHVPRPISLARIPPECDEQAQVINKTSEIVCNIGNPLRYNYTLHLELDMSSVASYTNASSEVLVELTTQSEETNFSDNTETLLINYDVDADLEIVGKSYNETYTLFEQDETKKNHSRWYRFDHVYEIEKLGATPIEEAHLTLKVPTHWKDSEIARIRYVQGHMKGRKVYCKNIVQTEDSDLTLLPIDETLAVSSDVDIPSDTGTFYLNCTKQKNVICQTFVCELGPFIERNSVARLTVTIDLQLSYNYTNESSEINGKDIVIFTSEALVKITYPNITFDSVNKKPDYKQIYTIFFRHRQANSVPLWIIVLSVLLGIALLILLSVLLMKLGFFNRKIKDDLDALKSNEKVNHSDNAVNEGIQTTSRTNMVY